MERLQDIGQILALCAKMTNLQLEVVCGFDRQFAAQWYENEYLTGRHVRYVMKPDKFIASVEDGKIYRAFNTSDAKAVELMESNPEYRDFFIDMEAVPDTIPELGDDPFAKAPEATEPEVTEPEQTEPTPEEIAEAEAAAKRSEAAKKAAATRAAKKAAEEAAEEAEKAENADISEFE